MRLTTITYMHGLWLVATTVGWGGDTMFDNDSGDQREKKGRKMKQCKDKKPDRGSKLKSRSREAETISSFNMDPMDRR